MADGLTKAQAAKAAKTEEQLAGERRCRRLQLERTEDSISKLTEALQSTRAKSPTLEGYISHLAGFYDEIDKLAKGKTLVEATELMVENVNSIIRDAKALIDGDVYIERLKEFVPAGENQVYPDILMVARTIQQATVRFRATIQSRRNKLAAVIREAETIKHALEFFIEDEEGYVPYKEDIETAVDNPPIGWFEFASEGGGPLFNFGRLDGLDVGKHLTTILTGSDAEE